MHSCQPIHILQRLVAFLEHRLQPSATSSLTAISEIMEASEDDLSKRLPCLLANCCFRSKLLIILGMYVDVRLSSWAFSYMLPLLDGLDKLATSSLHWLPSRFPPQCRVIVTTVDGDGIQSVLRKRKWIELEVCLRYCNSLFLSLNGNMLFKLGPLSVEERQQIQECYLKGR